MLNYINLIWKMFIIVIINIILLLLYMNAIFNINL